MTNSADLASCESADIQRRILELIEDASSIAISGHTSPDGDALGSVLGLGLSLMKFFPNKDIALLLADDDPVPRIYRFMEGSDRLVPASAYTGNPDLFISVDVPVVERLNNSAEVLRRGVLRSPSGARGVCRAQPEARRSCSLRHDHRPLLGQLRHCRT